MSPMFPAARQVDTTQLVPEEIRHYLYRGCWSTIRNRQEEPVPTFTWYFMKSHIFHRETHCVWELNRSYNFITPLVSPFTVDFGNYNFLNSFFFFFSKSNPSILKMKKKGCERLHFSPVRATTLWLLRDYRRRGYYCFIKADLWGSAAEHVFFLKTYSIKSPFVCQPRSRRVYMSLLERSEFCLWGQGHKAKNNEAAAQQS